jgi:hypothetical protein
MTSKSVCRDTHRRFNTIIYCHSEFFSNRTGILKVWLILQKTTYKNMMQTSIKRQRNIELIGIVKQYGPRSLPHGAL